MAVTTRSYVAWEKYWTCPFRTLDTVWRDTPAAAATSTMPTPRWEPTCPDLVPDTPPPTVAASSESTRLPTGARALPRYRTVTSGRLTREGRRGHFPTWNVPWIGLAPARRRPLDPRRSDSSKGSANASQKTSHRNPRCDQSGRRRHLVRLRRHLRPGRLTATHQC